MNKFVAGSIIFSFGGIVGAIITYSRTKKKFEDQLEEQMSFMTKRMNDKLSELQTAIDSCDEEKALMIETTEKLNKRIADAETLFEPGQTFEMHKATDEEIRNQENIVTAYNKIVKAREKEERVNKPEEIYDNLTYSAPYLTLISDVDFDEDNRNAKMTLTYFERDDVLAEGDTIMDINEILDRSILSHFGDYIPDHVFIRDTEDGIDYDVYRVDDVFYARL